MELFCSKNIVSSTSPSDLNNDRSLSIKKVTYHDKMKVIDSSKFDTPYSIVSANTLSNLDC